MESDNVVPIRQARELSQLEAVTMAMDHAAARGLAGHPQAFIDGLPWGWAIVNTNAVGQLAGVLMDALVGGLDGDDDDGHGDDDGECPACGVLLPMHKLSCPTISELAVHRLPGGLATPV